MILARDEQVIDLHFRLKKSTLDNLRIGEVL